MAGSLSADCAPGTVVFEVDWLADKPAGLGACELVELAEVGELPDEFVVVPGEAVPEPVLGEVALAVSCSF